MRMMFTQCTSSGIFRMRLCTLVAQVMAPCDARHALVVALALDARGFGRIAQVIVPCDAWHALVVDYEALALDVRCFGRITQVMVPCDARHVLLVDLRLLLNKHSHPKTLNEIAMVLSMNSGSFPSNSHVSATFSILLRFKVGLDIVDFCVISRRLISKIRIPHPISVADAICGKRFDLRDSKRRALEN